jgi:hypothetical protein
MLLMQHYFSLSQLLEFCTKRNYDIFVGILAELHIIGNAPGSTKNHQAWEGGYIDHITEVMNIAHWLYTSSPRPLPFGLADALEVLFLHDLEKPWKFTNAYQPLGTFEDFAATRCQTENEHPKQVRKDFRAALINHYGIILSSEQQNALEYVEGMRDKDYKSDERVMNELAAFCHTCDLWSARVWHDKGRERRW